MEKFDQTYSHKLIYVLSMPYETHKGLVKVGEASIRTNVVPAGLVPSCHLLNQAAKKRIDGYTKTASVSYNLLYTELASKVIGGFYNVTFSDKDVHKVLMNSGIHKVKPNGETGEEWFQTDVDTVKAAIKACKEGLDSIPSGAVQKKQGQSTIDFREEQLDAIERTLKVFEKDNEMLWYAKMRFGKTLTALEVIRRSQYRRVIIVTHRPVVDDGWNEDFKKIFFKGNSKHEYVYEKKTKDSYYTFDEKTDLENDLKIRKLDNEGNYFVYFASIQDLRGSKIVGGNYNKNNAVFALDWDMIVIDEAHEGTQTELGDNVIKKLKKKNTKVLALSGTPFNLLNLYNDDNVYTWDYVMEQKKKYEWDTLHHGDHNPYADLPKMHIYTYDLGEKLKKYIADDYETKAFNFREFFRVRSGNTGTDQKLSDSSVEGKFVHEADVLSFLNLLAKEDDESGYPFSTKEYRDMFRHTLWMVPGVKEARALSELLHKHSVFKEFGIANVAGEGDLYEEEHASDVLELVRNTIKNHPYSITLSCGKLTTGVTVKEWTAVLMLSGSYSTAAAQYMQTIFRVQSAGSIDGKQKTDCYVFDFAPDRTLKVLTETVHLSGKPGKSNQKHRDAMGEFLNYCPVISISGSRTRKYSVESMMEQIKQIYAERAVNSGFGDESIYNDELYKLDGYDAKLFNELNDIIGSTKAERKKGEVVVNGQGLTDEEIDNLGDPEPPNPKREKTPEERERDKKEAEAREARRKAIDILRGISIRMPMLIYGAEVSIDEDVSIERFVELVDDESWKEFMPNGVTKERFSDFIKYYDRDVFIAAGKRIRHLAATADKEPPTKRVSMIAEIFRHFKNPDKETVLTPWRVVNLHMSETIGGWCFFNEKYEDDTDESKNRLEEPRFVDKGSITKEVFDQDSNVLEINSKTGLYPLYVAYSFYRQRLGCESDEGVDPEKCKQIWEEVVKNNVYVICKTKMAKSITRRTLTGYTGAKINAHCFDDLINNLKNEPKKFIKDVLRPKKWGKEGEEMKFSAVVGNPPYQEEGNNNNRKAPIYHLFYDACRNLANFTTLITPARFLFDAGQTPKEWNQKMLNDTHFTVVRYFDDSQKVFSSVDIKGGVAIGLIDNSHEYEPIEVFTSGGEVSSILEKINPYIEKSITDICVGAVPYRFDDCIKLDYPDIIDVTGESFDLRTNIISKLHNKVFFSEKPNDGNEYIQIFGLRDKTRVKEWILAKYVLTPNNFYGYKVLSPKAVGAGKFGELYSKMEIAGPQVGHTQSFISMGNFETIEEAFALEKYIKSKFSRSLLSILRTTPDVTPYKWKYVPLQDFSSNSDIDWSKSITEIDRQLYTKYGLTDKEIDFIEKNVQPMS